MTDPGRLLGTVEYMAPERISGEPYDGRADVYGVGVLMYALLTGRLPFDGGRGPNRYVVAVMHLTEMPRRPRELNPEIPLELERLVLRALEKQPQNRPTAREMANELESIFDRLNPLSEPNLPRSIEGDDTRTTAGADMRPTEQTNGTE